MRNRVDPRTGKVSTVGSGGPLKKEPTPEPIQKKTIQIDLEKLVQELGVKLVQQLAEVLIRTGQTVPASCETLVSSKPSIQIDESIIDVGIGEQEELKIGEGSASLGQESASTDQLSSAKNKLKALKKGS